MVIRVLTAIVVVILAAVAAVVSYRHAFEVVVVNGETGFTAVLVPLTIDGLIFASSMVLLDSARRQLKVPKLARLTLVLGILATLAANVMHGWAHGPVGAIVAAWPAVALVLAYELLMGLIRRSAAPGQVHPAAVPVQVDEPHLTDDDIARLLDGEPAHDAQVQPEPVPEPDQDAPYRPVAVAQFLAEVAQGEPPSVRTIKDRMNVGTDRARRLQAYLGQLVEAAA